MAEEERDQPEAEIAEQEREFFAAWGRVRQQGVQSTYKLAHDQEMSATQYTILSLLERARNQQQEGCTISWLAGQMDLDPATVVRSVDVLEKRGLVQRRRDTRDRRLVFVEFTEQGYATQQAVQQRFMQRLSSTFRAMSREGRQALLKGLHEFLATGQQLDEREKPR